MTHNATTRVLSLYVAITTALFFTFGAIPSLSAKTVQAPGSRISLDLPDNFKSSPLFAGFMEIISSAAVITLELPAKSYDEVIAGFSAAALGKKDITNIKPGQLKRSDQHFFITGEQKHPRAVFEKFILVIKDSRNAAVITFNVPRGSFENGSVTRDTVITALTSAKLEDKAAPSRDLFKLSHLGPFEQTGAPTGTTRIYADKSDKSPKDTRNMLVIAPSLNRLPIKSITEFSDYAINNLKSAKGLTVKSAKNVKIDNMVGRQITASATRGKSNAPIMVRQLILLPANGGYFRLIAFTKTADEARLAPEIDKIFAGFRATETINAD